MKTAKKLLYAAMIGLVMTALAIIPAASAGKISIYVGGAVTYNQYDVNKDGLVDETDLNMVTEVYGEKGAKGWIREDVNKDGKIGIADVSGVTYHLGEGTINTATIQSAIDAASAGDTITIRKGTYKEKLVINKAVKLVGENKPKTFIDGGGKGIVITINTPVVTISTLTIQKADTGIKVTCKGTNDYGNVNYFSVKKRVDDIYKPLIKK
jgi:hypothetical protein